MTITHLFCDVDGCLTTEDSRPFAADEIDSLLALPKLLRSATTPIQLILVTGRPQPYVECLCKLMDIQAPAICESGAVLYQLKGNRAWPLPTISQQSMRKLRHLEEYLLTELLPGRSGCEFQWGKKLQLSVYSEHHEPLEELSEGIALWAKDHDLPLDIGLSVNYLNISIAGTDKGSAIRYLQNHMNLSKEHCAGIGDTAGDLSIRSHVAFFGAPANAIQSIKDVADYVSPFEQIDGVLDIVARLAKLG